jgi:CubicO group peptidase (beta-lactamase class C family)
MILALLFQVAAAQGTEAARVDKIFAPWNKQGSPGCAVGVVRDGRLVYQRGYGSLNTAGGGPLTSRSVFYMASVSKQFAAASVLLAVMDGKLSLDDPARKWLPELPAAAGSVTVGDLVHHLSGLRDYLTLWGLMGRLGSVNPDAELLRLLTRQQAVNFEPRTEFSYSNSGYVVLTFILKRATGKTLSEFAEERIFKPLGMRNTHFHEVRTERHDPKMVAIAYSPDGPGGKLKSGVLPEFDKVGDGGLYSTVEDMARWAGNFDTGTVGGPEFLKRQLERAVLASGDTINYAAGLAIDRYKSIPVVEHAGGFMGYRTEFLRFPEQRFAVIALCNLGTIDPAVLNRRVADVYLESDFARRLARFAGVYRSDELELDANVSLRGGDLYLIRGGQPAVWLEPALVDYGAKIKDAGDRFSFEGLGQMTVAFIADGNGPASALTIDAGRAKGMRFERTRQP